MREATYPGHPLQSVLQPSHAWALPPSLARQIQLAYPFPLGDALYLASILCEALSLAEERRAKLCKHPYGGCVASFCSSQSQRKGGFPMDGPRLLVSISEMALLRYR